ncbi:MAG: DUF2341 domain-containing protein [Planctomycetota bacterium]
MPNRSPATWSIISFCAIISILSMSCLPEQKFTAGSSAADKGLYTETVSPTNLAELTPLKPDGYYLSFEATGKEFILKDNPISPNLRIVSSEEIHIIIEAITNTVSLYVEPLSTTTATATDITIWGLEPFYPNSTKPLTLFRHQDGYFQEEFKLDAEDKYSYVQDIKSHHHTYFLPCKGTVNIGLEASGQPPPLSPPYSYNNSTRTYTLTRNIQDFVVIVASNITLDGANFRITGTNSGYGIYLANYNTVTITRCTVQNFTGGIKLQYSNGNLLTGNIVQANSYFGIYLWPSANSNRVIRNQVTSNGYGIADSSSYNIIADNTANLNGVGIETWGSLFPTLTNNNVISNSTGFNIGRIGSGSNVSMSGNTASLNTAVGINLYYNSGPCYIYHNNIYSNALNVYSTNAIQLSFNNEGNWWGKNWAPGFYRPGEVGLPYYDSNSRDIWDPNPYLVKDGWLWGYAPGQAVADIIPPVITNLSPADGAITTSLRPIISAEYYDLPTAEWGNYRIPITILNGSTALTDYPVSINIPYNSNMRSDFADIRFFDTMNNELPYWIESKIDSISTRVWVKIPILPANTTTTIYMYYNNPLAVSNSSGDLTFEFFDDFSAGFDNNKWNRNRDASTGGGGAFVLNGELNVYAGNGNCPGWAKSKVNLPNKIVVETRQRVVRYNDYTLGTFKILNSSSGAEVAGVVYDYYIWSGSPGDAWYGWYVNRDSFAPLPLPIPNVPVRNLTPYWNDTWFTQKLFYDGTSSANNFKYVRDKGTGEESIVHTATATSENLRINFQPWAWWDQPNNRFYIDWVFVRKYVAVEPSVSLGAPEPSLSSVSGIDLSSVKMFLDSPTVTVPATVTANKVSYTPVQNLTSGLHTVKVQVDDLAGNKAETIWSFQIIPSDTTPPVTSPTVTPAPNPAGWNNTNVTVKLETIDPGAPSSGVKEIHYRINNPPETVVVGNSVNIPFTTEGVFTLFYYAIDNANNVEPTKELVVRIDRTKPTITYNKSPSANTAGWNNSDVMVTFYATDDRSGVASISSPITITTEGANQWISGTAVDYAGNSATINVVVNLDKTSPQISNLPATFIVTNEDFAPIVWDLSNCMTDNLTAPNQLTWQAGWITFTNTTPPIDTFKVSLVGNTLTISAPPDVNGTGSFVLLLSDLSGLSDYRIIPITITAINNLPTVNLTYPGMSAGDVLSGATNIRWSASDDNDLLINIYYNVAGGTWLALAENLPNTGSYSWNTATGSTAVRDDYRYRIRVDAVEQNTIEKYAASASSTNYFTINNYPLTITGYKPIPKYFNSFSTATVRLIFELSEPAFNVVVSLYQYDFYQGYIYIGQFPTYPSLDAGIHSVEWDGSIPPGSAGYARGTFIFAVTATDYQSNTVSWSPSPDKYKDYNFKSVAMPVFIEVKDKPDPVYIGSPISSTIYYSVAGYPSSPTLPTLIKVMDEKGNVIETLPPALPYPLGGYFVNWYAQGITENGVFSYEISDNRTVIPPGESKANPVTGTITVLKLDTRIIQSSDLSATVYAFPATASVTITPKPEIASGVTYALGSLNPITATPYTYPVSPFYDITATGVATPTIIAIKYPSYLAPQYVKLFRYNPDNNTLVAITRTVVDSINYVLYAEVDTFSLFVLMASPDETAPQIQNLLLTPQVFNFTLTDDLSGINIPSISVILDGQDITDKLTISGNTGDLTVSVFGIDVFQPSLLTHTMAITAQDRGGNEVRKDTTFGAGYTDVEVVIKPEALNINPGILTAYMKLPQSFGVPITLDATLDGGALDKWMVSYEDMPEEGLTAPIIVMKFRRQAIEQALSNNSDVLDTEFILKGSFDDGTAPYGQPYEFEGSDSVTKIISDETPSTGPPEQSEGGKKK